MEIKKICANHISKFESRINFDQMGEKKRKDRYWGHQKAEKCCLGFGKIEDEIMEHKLLVVIEWKFMGAFCFYLKSDQ